MKKQIVEHLLKAEQITFDEALELMDREQVAQPYIVQPYIAPHPYTYPSWPYPNITCGTFTAPHNPNIQTIK